MCVWTAPRPVPCSSSSPRASLSPVHTSVERRPVSNPQRTPSAQAEGRVDRGSKLRWCLAVRSCHGHQHLLRQQQDSGSGPPKARAAATTERSGVLGVRAGLGRRAAAPRVCSAEHTRPSYAPGTQGRGQQALQQHSPSCGGTGPRYPKGCVCVYSFPRGIVWRSVSKTLHLRIRMSTGPRLSDPPGSLRGGPGCPVPGLWGVPDSCCLFLERISQFPTVPQ